MRKSLFLATLWFALVLSAASVRSQTYPSWPVKQSSNSRYLVDEKGRPFFALGDCLWKMHLYKPEEVDLIFDDRAEKGFTVMCVATGCEGALANYAGQHAFGGDDLARPNEGYWSHIDYVVQAAKDRGMAVMLNPIWIRHHRERIRRAGPQGCYEYGKWISRRYGPYQNVMFFVGGDHPPREERDETNLLAQGIKDIWPEALITYHAVHQHPSRDYFPDAEWLDINWTYAYTPEHRKPDYPYSQGFEEWRDHPDTPVWFGEGYYDWGGKGLSGNDGGRYMMRRQMYWVLLSSIAGYNYGAEGVQDRQNNYSGNGMTWQETLDYPSSYDCKRMVELLAELKWWKLVPDYDNKTLTSGYGHFMGDRGDDYAPAARAHDGSFALVYTPVARKLQIDMSRFKGTVKAKWFDPTNGEHKRAGSYENSGSCVFTSPGDNGTGEEDWLLVLQADK